MKRTAITGHTSGIGKGLYDYYFEYLRKRPLSGFSRSNGFDIGKEEDRQRIIHAATEGEIFINNAYHPIGQIKLFNNVYNVWKDQGQKTIVNIISKVKYSEFVNNEYIVCKKELYRAASNAIRDSGRQCRIININPGFIQTNLIDEEHTAELSGKIMSLADAVKLITWAIEQPQGIEIGELSFWLTGS